MDLHYLFCLSYRVLMFAKGTLIQNRFLFLSLLYKYPLALRHGSSELELPFIALMLVIVSPFQITNLRGRQEGIGLSLAIAAFLAFQHFTRVASLKKAFDQGSIIATLAILCIFAVPCLLLI